MYTFAPTFPILILQSATACCTSLHFSALTCIRSFCTTTTQMKAITSFPICAKFSVTGSKSSLTSHVVPCVFLSNVFHFPFSFAVPLFCVTAFPHVSSIAVFPPRSFSMSALGSQLCRKASNAVLLLPYLSTFIARAPRLQAVFSAGLHRILPALCCTACTAIPWFPRLWWCMWHHCHLYTGFHGWDDVWGIQYTNLSTNGLPHIFEDLPTGFFECKGQ